MRITVNARTEKELKQRTEYNEKRGWKVIHTKKPDFSGLTNTRKFSVIMEK